MHSSLKVPTQHFDQPEVWTLTGSLFQRVCCGFAAVIMIIVLLHDRFDQSDRWPRI